MVQVPSWGQKLWVGQSQDECGRALSAALFHCATLRVLVASHKTEGPSSKLVFLGIELDATNWTLCPPDEKLSHL